jgi:hypothetical protein
MRNVPGGVNHRDRAPNSPESRPISRARTNSQLVFNYVVERRMSRCATAVVVAGVLVCLLATPAYPCLNGTILEGDQAVQRVVQVERALEQGNYGEASRLLQVDHFLNDHVVARWNDARTLLYLRTNPRKSARTAIEYFAARSKQDPKSIKHRAWLAEAYGAGGKRDDALRIFVDLRERDLMPDGFAWRALANLSTGSDVDALLEVCRKRSKYRNICTIEMATYKPPKRVPANKMKL